MLRKTLCILISTALTLTLFIGCNNKNTNTSNENDKVIINDSNSNDSPSNDEESNNNNVSNSQEEEVAVDELIENKLIETMTTLYNTDYSSETSLNNSLTYIKNNFTNKGAESIINHLDSYTSEISFSDFLITLIEKVDNESTDNESVYNVRYNITIIDGKPSVYSDVSAKIIIDNNTNSILIDNLNNNNF